MTALQTEDLTVFYCYAHEDQEFREQLEQHLSNLKRLYHLKTWFDRQILPGENWEKVLEEKLRAADLIFLLISPAFMASDYCYNREMGQALARHNRGEARVIPILLRPVHWKNAPFSTIQMLPKDALSVASWKNRDDAFYDIILGIEKIVEDFLLLLQRQEAYQSQETFQASDTMNQLQGELDPHEQALSHFSSNMMISISQGDTLHKQGKYQEAVHVYMQAIGFNPNAVIKGPYKGNILTDLQKAEDALVLDPRSTPAYRNKVSALLELQRYEEALVTCKQFMQPGFYVIAVDYSNKAYALTMLGHYEEALQACEQALRLKTRLAAAYKNKAYALYATKRYKETLQACKQALDLKPDLAATYALMGMAFFQLEEYENASTAFSLWSKHLIL
jgi:tetratricopeptide (TPR) repeat protein